MSKASDKTRSISGVGTLYSAKGDRILSFNELLGKNEWTPAVERERCTVCSVKFSAFRRKHHCRMCGEVVCANCTMKKEALLPILGVSKVKLCKPCAVAVGQESYDPHPKRASDAAMTMASGEDFDVSEKELEELEALLSPNPQEAEKRSFSGWDVSSLDVEWFPGEQMKDVRQLSKDEHASVWLVEHQGSRQLVAKRLDKANRTQQFASDFVDDIKLASRLQHPRILELIGASWTPDRDIQALFEYLPGGDLRAYLDATRIEGVRSPQRKIEKLRIALDIAEALAYVHSLDQPLHHRALESSNVLLTADNRAKIGGFGAVRVESLTSKNVGQSEVARWLAPEVISGNGAFNAACDIYSLGVILSELDTHLIPFSDCRGPQGNILPTVAVLFLISLGQAKPTMSRECPPEIRQLANECLSFEPSERPTAIDVVARLRTFIRSMGLQNTLEAAKSPQQEGIMLCDPNLM